MKKTYVGLLLLVSVLAFWGCKNPITAPLSVCAMPLGMAFFLLSVGVFWPADGTSPQIREYVFTAHPF